MSEENTTSVFDQVKGKVSLEKYFGDYLKRDLRMEGTNLMACVCPWHDERTPSLKIYLDEEHFRCFGSCDFGGTIIDAVMKSEDFDAPIDAVEWLNNHYKLGLTNTSKHAKQFHERIEKVNKKFESAEAEMNDPNSKVAARARKMLTDRGISEETRAAFGLSVHKEDARILIPIFERGNHRIAWSGRALMDRMPCPNCKTVVEAQDVFNQRLQSHTEGEHTGSAAYCREDSCVQAAKTCPSCQQQTLPLMLAGQFPKYRDAPGYQKKETLYNLPQARTSLRQQKDVATKQPLLVMEGFGDVWAAHQVGFPGSVAYNGGVMTFGQASQVAELARSLGRWVGLVPDTDPTGRSSVHKNIESLRKADQNCDVRVLHGIENLRRDDDKPCKDIGEVVQYHGNEIAKELLTLNWWGADEFKIREIIDGPWDKLQQIEQITGVLADARHTIALDDLVPLLASHWGATDEGPVRTFLHNSHSRGAQLQDSARLISTIVDAHRAAELYLEDSFAISTDYETINDCLPGGGFRLGQLSMVLGKSGTGKTTLIGNLIWQFLRSEQLPTIFFSLEQPRAQVYITLVQVALGITSKEAEDLVKNRDDALNEVDELFERLTIIDNVPGDAQAPTDMTPERIAQLIHEVNLTRGGDPTKIVCIDHLGLIKANSTAPQSIKDNDAARSGYAMEEFFAICKQTQTFFMVLQQLPKEVPPGEEFGYDAGRGASQQTDFCDYIFCIWRPDQAKGLSEDEKTAYEGQYKFKLGKNRHGPNNVVAHLTFDHQKRRITTESAYGIPTAFMPPSATAVDLAGLQTGAPPGLFEDAEGGGEAPPSWFLS